MVADGHDEASSTLATKDGTPLAQRSWTTPSGQIVREGRSYEIESRLVLSIVRIERGIRHLGFRYRDFIVSEELELNA